MDDQPSLDTLPSIEHVNMYRQRDINPSHLYRLGTNLFGPRDKICRLRVINPKDESHLSIDACSFDAEKKGSLHRFVSTAHKLPLVIDDGYHSDCEYKKWLCERNKLRLNLDSLGTTQYWLRSKRRTPLEDTQLIQLLQESKVHQKDVSSTISLEELSDRQEKDKTKKSSKYFMHSTMMGNHGHIADKHKQEEIRQFEFLVTYGICLNQKLAEKALLLPLDNSKKDCEMLLSEKHLDMHLHKSHNVDSCNKKRSKRIHKLDHQYIKPSMIYSRNKHEKVGRKVDCWLTYEEYLKLTE